MKSMFITGAVAGTGRATARLIADRGWFIGAADLDEAPLHSLQEELGSGSCSVHVTDVSNAASGRQALAGFTAQTGGAPGPAPQQRRCAPGGAV